MSSRLKNELIKSWNSTSVINKPMCCCCRKWIFFLFLPIIIRRHTADFLAREFDFLFRRGEQICKFPTLYVGIQSHCISVMWLAISFSAIQNIHSCAGMIFISSIYYTIVVISKNNWKFMNQQKYTFTTSFLDLALSLI